MCRLGSCSRFEFEGPSKSSYPALSTGAIELMSLALNPLFDGKPPPPPLSRGHKSLLLMPIDARPPHCLLAAPRELRKPAWPRLFRQNSNLQTAE